MKPKSSTVILAAILVTAAIVSANPLPVPPPASMPLEEMYVQIQPDGNGLDAVFTGLFTFVYIPKDVNSMLFPVPPDANNIRVWADSNELPWTPSEREYPTILPEMPNIPMIEWQGPFHPNGAVFRVDYEHDLIERPNSFLFFYALGTGKYFPSYEKTTTAYFDILLPVGYTVKGVWLDDTPHEYEVVNGHLMLTVESWFGPITNDLIVSLAPTTIYVATDGNDVTGDGSAENPFRTIQRGIDTAADGCTVIVQPGRYTQNINFLGKNITLTSTNPTNSNIVSSTTIGGGVHFRGTEDPCCTLTGFNIDGYISGFDYPYGQNHTHATISHCLLCGNAICCTAIENCDGTISNCLIANNYNICDCISAVVNGCHGLIKNCTILNGDPAVGVLDGSATTIENCIIYRGPGIYPQITVGSGATLNISYSDVQSGLEGIELKDPCNCKVDWGPENIDADPLFADLNNGDYHLKSEGWRWDANRKVWTWDDVTSPCIDAGNPGCALGDELLSVPDDPNNEWGENLRINMGAYGGTAEASMGLPGWALLADLTNDGIVDFFDLAAFVNYWLETGECIPSDLNRSQSVDFADFAIFAKNWLKGEPPTDELVKPGLAEYYVPYDNHIEPNAPGYTLPLNLNDVENYAYMYSKFGLGAVAPLLEQNGFAVIEYDFGDLNDIVEPYEHLRKRDVPLFVSADTLLHLYHIQFDETLKDVEEREFVSDINDLTAALLDEALAQYAEHTGDLQEAARRNVAYLAVAQKLIDPNAQIPALVVEDVVGELAKIDAHEGFRDSDIFIYAEDYSQYVPRGHYTRSEQLKRYFRTLMWYGRMAFLLKGAEFWGPMGEALISVYDAKIQTMQAVLLATSLDTVQVGPRSGHQVWDRMYAVTAFYVGLADDLTPYEYLGVLNKVFGSGFTPTDLDEPDNFFALKAELALLRSPKINGGTGDVWVPLPITPESLDEVLDKTKGMRFMGQRFIPDSYMFQQLVTPKVLGYTGDGNPIPFSYGTTPIGPQRCYPRGLDVMAILGSNRARTILIDEGDTDYVDYWPRFNELKVQFDAFDVSDWNRNLYWGWLYSLRALMDEFGEGYPNFMRTEAWEKKELNAALASWTQLRHDTILYAKQSYTPAPTGPSPPPPPDVSGYVEPVPEFYGRLLALTRMTREGLNELNALSAQATERLVNLEGILTRLIEIANKELTNEVLAEDDHEYIREFGKTLETAVIGIEDTGVMTTLVADVHTYSYEKLVVEEAVGYVELIITACPMPDGSIFLAAGPVLSYYEFKHPMSDRLTDKAWREMLDSPNRPDRPTWWPP